MIYKKFVVILSAVLISSLVMLSKNAAYALPATHSNLNCRCQPNEPCWPSKKAWSSLRKELKGHLFQPTLTLKPCLKNSKSRACLDALERVKNPFLLQANAADTISQGLYQGWQSQVSAYVVEAKSTEDIIAALRFANRYHLRIAIKGTGHDFLGRSNAKNSLLIWTHALREVKYHPHFKLKGYDTDIGSALTIGAGVRWVEAYEEATTKYNQYIQGGGCTSVGAAGGFIQGGGFGSFSKKYGMAAESLLEAEVVTADGRVLIANRYQNTDLFWALRGGGGGTFGVVTKLTIKTHPLPQYVGFYSGEMIADSDLSYRALLQQFVTFYRTHLNNEHWGEQVTFAPDNTIRFLLTYQGKNKAEVEATWRTMKDWLAARPKQYQFTSNLWSIPPRKLWDTSFWKKRYPEFVNFYEGKEALVPCFWYASNRDESMHYLYAYQSWWLPFALFSDSHKEQLVNAIFNASRLAKTGFHLNKGLSGASSAVAQHDTAMNPKVYEAAGLIIMGANTNKVHPGIKGYEPNMNKIEEVTKRITHAMQFFMDLAPQAGSYTNESNYFQTNWQAAFWGKHYKKLLDIKNKYDPAGLFYCHHCVGSEYWSMDGMCRLPA